MKLVEKKGQKSFLVHNTFLRILKKKKELQVLYLFDHENTITRHFSGQAKKANKTSVMGNSNTSRESFFFNSEN